MLRGVYYTNYWISIISGFLTKNILTNLPQYVLVFQKKTQGNPKLVNLKIFVKLIGIKSF